MKSLLLPLAIFSSVVLFSQEIITKDIVSINTKEKNSKTILFAKKISNNKTSFILEANNKTSKDYSKCKWVTDISSGELKYFVDELVALEPGISFESSLFHIIYKKDKIKVKFLDTKCTSEHKTHYFQESCKRTLQFVLSPQQSITLSSSINKELNNSLVQK